MPNDPPPDLATATLNDRRWLRSLSASLVGPSDADDLAQEAWLVALKRRARADAGPQVPPTTRGWLAGIAYRLAAAQRRQRHTRREHEHRHAEDRQAEGRDDPGPAVDGLVEQAELESEVVHLLLQLPVVQRDALLLRFQAGLSSAEVAQQLGLPPGTVRRQQKAGLDQLRVAMDRRHGGRTSWAPALLGTGGVQLPSAVAGGSAAAPAWWVPAISAVGLKASACVAMGMVCLLWLSGPAQLADPACIDAAVPGRAVGWTEGNATDHDSAAHTLSSDTPTQSARTLAITTEAAAEDLGSPRDGKEEPRERVGRFLVHIMGEAGSSIEGATIFASGPGSNLTQQSDAQGRAELLVPATSSIECFVRASGFMSERVTLTVGSPDEVHSIRLRLALRVELTVVDHEGNPRSSAKVRFAPAASQESTGWAYDDWFGTTIRGGPLEIGRDPQGIVTYGLLPDADGMIVLDGLPLSAQLLCGFQDERWQWTQPPLDVSAGPGGFWKGVLIDPRLGTSHVRGRVVERNGLPVAGAKVYVANSKPRMTDSHGAFNCPVSGEDVTSVLTVSAAGFAPQIVAYDVSSPDSEPLQITLAPERSLTVHLRNADGSPAEDVPLTISVIRPDGSPWRVDSTELIDAGLHRTHQVPSGALLLTTDLGDLVYHWRVPVDAVDVTVTLDEPGEIELDWTALGQAIEGIALRRVEPGASDARKFALAHEFERAWRVEDPHVRQMTLRWVPGRYELVLGSGNQVAARQEVVISAGGKVAIQVGAED